MTSAWIVRKTERWLRMKHFGKWLKETRTKRGLTQVHLAQSIGVTDSYISHLEHGDFLTKEGTPSRPAVEIIDAMAQALGVSCEEARLAAAYAPAREGPQVTFGQWVRDARLKSGISQETLAFSIGVTSAYISLLEGKKALTRKGYPIRPSLHLVDAIASTLGTSREEARLAAGYAPPETAPSALQKLGLLDMFLRLPVNVQEDVKAQVEGLYLKYSTLGIMGPRPKQSSETADDQKLPTLRTKAEKAKQ